MKVYIDKWIAATFNLKIWKMNSFCLCEILTKNHFWFRASRTYFKLWCVWTERSTILNHIPLLIRRNWHIEMNFLVEIVGNRLEIVNLNDYQFAINYITLSFAFFGKCFFLKHLKSYFFFLEFGCIDFFSCQSHYLVIKWPCQVVFLGSIFFFMLRLFAISGEMYFIVSLHLYHCKLLDKT